MPEQELNTAAAKFISSLAKSLQILCNGQVDFAESIELVGHINVKVDHRFKFDYIVDEQVSREEDSSTTFLSNSYHSCPPSKQTSKKVSPSDLDQQDMFSEIPQTFQRKAKQSKSTTENIDQHSLHAEDTSTARDESSHNYSISVECQGNQPNQMVVKLEEGEDSNDCMVLPASPGNYNETGEGGGTETFPIAGPSGSFEDSQGGLSNRPRKRRKISEQGTPDEDRSMESTSEKELSGMTLRSAAFKTSEKTTEQPQGNTCFEKLQPVASSDYANPVNDMKCLIARLASLCDMTVVQEELMMLGPRNVGTIEEDIKTAKKKFLESFDKEKLKKMKEVLKMKKGRQKKQKLKCLLAESGLSNEQLLLLAQDTSMSKKRICWKSIPEGPGKEAMLKEHRRTLRVKTQERQQKLLEMAEMLKRNQMNDPGVTVMSKNGGKKCLLHKSSVSVVSHNTQQLSLDNIDEVSEALTGKTKKTSLLQPTCQEKSKDQIKVEYSRKNCLKKKMKQIVGKMLTEVNDAGYRVIVTSTIGSEAGSHSAELSVVPLRVDDFFPETKESDMKPELTEEEYAKQLEREQILEKQKANEEKMKEMEIKLMRILTGAEEIFIPTRKRYSPGEPRPSDAERMKEYRKKLKQDPEKYQVYKQKRAMSKKRRRLGELAAKVKVNATGATVTVIPAAPVNEETHGSQSMGALVSMTQPVGSVNMHCPQVYDHPSSHQPAASVVNVHHTTQYVGQVSGIHATHQHQQPMTYGNEMDIVELIAATHNVQNQHFG